MNKQLIRGLLFCVFSVMSIQNVFADGHESPFKGGDYWEVTGIKIADGSGLKYSKWLASEWRANLDFAKSQGWVSDYKVLGNVHARADESDLYLVVVFDNLTTGDEDDKRRKKYLEWAKKSMETMQGESANRAEYRTVMSTLLFQELNFRN